MLFDRPIRLWAICLPIFLLLIPTFFSMYSTWFCLLSLLVRYFADSGVLSTNSWCLALSKIFERRHCQTIAHIHDDCSWNSELTYDGFLDELGDNFVFDIGIGFYLHPLTKVVGWNKQKLLCYSNGQRDYYVHPLLRKWARTCDRIEGLWRYMGACRWHRSHLPT